MAMGPVWALGLMSGTSMDGIDGAAVLTDGVDIQGFGPKRFEPYAPEVRKAIRAALGTWESHGGEVASLITRAHGDMITYFPTVEVAGFHGQTLSHEPQGRGTLQAGDGMALAQATGKRVVWDFRTADVASGGEGAPLIPFFHHACARMLGLSAPVAFLNIGGVGNVTWVDPLVAAPEALGAVVAFDTGPGNALIDDLVAQAGQGQMDEGGAMAATGTVDEGLVAEVLADPYFERPPPKSLDRNHFAWVVARVAGHFLPDALATLSAITSASIAAALRHMPEPPSQWLVGGGGRHNATVMGGVQARSNTSIAPVEAVGLDGDFLEAQAFAWLAVRVERGLPTSGPTSTGARLPVSGGRISYPDTPDPVLAAVEQSL